MRSGISTYLGTAPIECGRTHLDAADDAGGDKKDKRGSHNYAVENGAFRIH